MPLICKHCGTRVNKSQYLKRHFGGNWKYDNMTGWWCDDNIRHVLRVSTCFCEDPCKCPVRYYIYDEKDSHEIVEWFGS